jgi:fibronectin type 3 domain-containing protein
MKYLLMIVLVLLSAKFYGAPLPAATTHSVSLSWTAPTSSPDPITGYFVYREQVGNGSFSELNESQITGTAYMDTALLYGVSYEYYVTSADAEDNQSVPSNTVTAAIPFVPYTPVVGTIQGL